MLAVSALIAGAALLLIGPNSLLALTNVIPAILALLIVLGRTTRGGWRWRWGERD